MEQSPFDFGVISVYLPPPISITIATDTFIRFEVCPGSLEQVGIVKYIATDTSQLTIRRFLSLVELREYINPGDSILDEVSLWLTNSTKPPYYLCDSNLCLDVAFTSIRGCAFVFFGMDPIVNQLRGMANTYLVTSFFDSLLRTVRHGRTFNSFPSVMYPHLFPTCHASDLFYKLLNLKQKIQEKLNTMCMSKQNRQVVSIENFDVNAWAYVLKCCPVQVSSSLVVVKSIYMNEDECHVEK